MLGQKKKQFQNLSFFADLLAAVILVKALYYFLQHFSNHVSSLIQKISGYSVELEDVTHLHENFWIFFCIIICLLFPLLLNGFYRLDQMVNFNHIIFESFKACLMGLGIATLFLYSLSSIAHVNRSWMIGFFISFFCYQIGKEYLFRNIVLKKYPGNRRQKAIVVGSAEAVARKLAELEARHSESVDVETICLTKGNKKELRTDWAAKVKGNSHRFRQLLSKYPPDIVILVNRGSNITSAQDFIKMSEEQGIECWYFADYLEPALAQPEIDIYCGEPVIIFSTVPHYQGSLILKRIIDVVGAASLLVCLTPFLLVVLAAIKLTSRGPVFYQQQRTGFRGRPFMIYKFRTMTVGADSMQQALADKNKMSGPVFKINNDPRITPIGKWLRKFSIDEIPQLWNVIIGDMSLVGPRPLPVYEVEKFPCFSDRRRLSVLPGLTCLWQISGRNNITNFTDWVNLDLQYIDQWSIQLDLRILLKTVPVVIFGQGAS